MKKYTCFYTFLFFTSVILGIYVSSMTSRANSNMVTGYFRGDFVPGIAQSGTSYLSYNGYGNYGINVSESPNHFYNYALSVCDVILIHTHGNDGYFTTKPSNGVISGNSVTSYAPSNSAKLVYISACYSGNSSAAYGNVCSALCSKGVSAVVAFTGTITASTGSNGIHSFNLQVIQKLKSGISLYSALAQVKQIFIDSGTLYGSDTAVFYGNGGLTL